jgi:tRNA dimethylallyltransferase
LEEEKLDLICILGPTASGKTALAVALAKMLGGEVISADSRQVYRGMDIGTGKDLDEYNNVSYHLIDILDAGEIYGVGQFQKDFSQALHEIKSRKHMPILCGGTGLYLQAVLQNFSHTYIPRDFQLRDSLIDKEHSELKNIFENLPMAHSFNADTSTHKRLIRAIEIAKWLENNELIEEPAALIKPIIFGINLDWDTRRSNISKRLQERFDKGLVREVQQLLDNGISADMLIFYGLEYKIITQHLLGEYTLEECFNKLEIAIHQFAKRQMTYFRKMEKDGLEIIWVNQNTLAERLDFITKFVP